MIHSQMVIKTEIRQGTYYDSVVLMQLQRSLASLDGVIDAGVVMATPANIELLTEGSLMTQEAKEARPDDLLIVIKGASENVAIEAFKQVDALLARRSSKISSAYTFRSLDSAAKANPKARWILISVPGRYAAAVAREALSTGRHVFLYSDNVSLADEIELKSAAREKGLLVMGPDCGTALINGIGLGFANQVRRGPIGLVGASGTGLQAVMVGIHQTGSGVSQVIGTGGRDLKKDVRGITTLQGLGLLMQDPDTKVIGLISKPPDAEISAKLLAAAQITSKPVIINFIGYPAPCQQLGNLLFTRNLHEAAQMAVAAVQSNPHAIFTNSELINQRKYLRGLFSGGTLAVETVLLLQNMLHPLFSNVPVNSYQKLENPFKSQGHTIIDMGDDVFTQGRLHPMMDNDLRIRRMIQEATDPDTGALVMDIVLGEGAHPDPASELAPVVEKIKKETGIPTAVVIIGTEEDPQNISTQIQKMEKAGAVVLQGSSGLATFVKNTLPQDPVDFGRIPSLDDIKGSFSAINVGLETFNLSLTEQGAKAVQVDWRPPAGGNEKLMGILSKLKGSSHD